MGTLTLRMRSQVLWVVIRKTYGWHKKVDAISLGQFSLLTGMTRQHCHRSLKKLESKGIIGVAKIGNSSINSYSIIKNFDKWKVLPKLATVLPKLVVGVAKIGSQVLPKKGNTKETIQKKLLQKKIPQELPEDFTISESVRKWAEKGSYYNLPEHLESFKLSCEARGYTYVNFDAAFKKAIRENWAKIGSGGNGDGRVKFNGTNEKRSILQQDTDREAERINQRWEQAKAAGGAANLFKVNTL
jgi:hypothetical protein